MPKISELVAGTTADGTEKVPAVQGGSTVRLTLAKVATTASAADLTAGALPAARMPALTGDVTTSAGAVATTLATVNSNVGSFGTATQASQVTVDGKGRVTAAANVTVTPAVASITGLASGVATALANPLGAAGGLALFKTGPVLNALDYSVTGDGSTNDASAINTFFTTCSTAGSIAYFQGGKTYILGSTQIVVPDGLTVLCGLNATFTRTTDPGSSGTWATTYGTYTGAMISLGNNCRWSGGVLNNTAVLGTSTTSFTPNTGAKTFTVSAGLNIVATNFLRFSSSGAGSAHMEGTVTSYSGTSLVMNFTFSAGSGAHTDWNIFAGAVYQAPMVLHGVTETLVENVRLTGNWYVGFLMDGWNPSGGGSLTVSYCTFRNCWAESVLNRGFYIYGNCNDNLIDGCFVQGSTGTTDYGVNLNPANASGSVNGQLRNKIANCTVNGAAFQGYEIGDICDYNVITGCTANNLTDSTSAGFLIQLANTQVPAYNRIIGCIANNCAGFGYQIVGVNYGGVEGCLAVVCGEGYRIGPSGGTQCTEVSINNSEANACTSHGFHVQGNSSRCDLNSIKAVNNTGDGVIIDAGAVRTLVTGRMFNNTAGQLLDNGTSSVITNVTTV